MRRLILLVIIFCTVLAVCAAQVGSTNDDAFLTTPQLIVKHGYPVEIHTITTKDGYILTYYRIPCGKNGTNCTGFRPPVLIQHGLLSDSTNWLETPEENALPYLMANEGYDVWLGNARGSAYSLGHVSLTPSEPEYWDFSWHEMGVYDLTAGIDHILESTNKTKLNYVGHSMGTTMFFVMGSERPEYMKKIICMIAYAPVAYTQYILGPTHACALALGPPLAPLSIGIPPNITDYVHTILSSACSLATLNADACYAAISTVTGPDPAQLNYVIYMAYLLQVFLTKDLDVVYYFGQDYFPVILSRFPSSGSTKCLQHYCQGMYQSILTGEPEFRQFDYGSLGNFFEYGSSDLPPSYNLTNINCLKYFFIGGNDYLGTPKDVNNTMGKMPNTNYITVGFPPWNHIDFIIGINASDYCHRPAILLLNEANGI